MAPPTVEICKEHSGHSSRLSELESSDIRQWDAITKLQSRLPVWATVLISVLTFFLGASITYATLVVKISEIAKK